jgi:hypothetical protein
MTVPNGPDGVNLALLLAAVKAGANRSEWASKALIDVKHAKQTATPNAFSNSSFANAPSLSELQFTDVSVGDKVILYASANISIAAMTPDGTGDPEAQLRWLIDGVTDISVGPSATYPFVAWGSTVQPGASDYRQVSFADVHTATAAGTMAARLQIMTSTGAEMYCNYASIIGVHLRLGAG